jgi:hypothetical protein
MERNCSRVFPIRPALWKRSQLTREQGYGLFEERAATLIEAQSAAETDRR